METPYGGLWYAAGNPDGFRFGAVNRIRPDAARVVSDLPGATILYIAWLAA